MVFKNQTELTKSRHSMTYVSCNLAHQEHFKSVHVGDVGKTTNLPICQWSYKHITLEYTTTIWCTDKCSTCNWLFKKHFILSRMWAHL